MFKKILHPTDFTDVSLYAFREASSLAAKLDASLKVLHVIRTFENKRHESQLMKMINAELDDVAEQSLTDLITDAPSRKPFIKTAFTKGISAGNEIVETAQTEHFDLIIMGTHGESPVRHFFLGSVAEYVVRYAPCPVMVLGRGESRPVGQYKKILLATDFSKTSHAAAEQAVRFGKRYGARLQFLHVIDDMHTNRSLFYETTPISGRKLKERVRDVMEQFVQKHQTHGVTISTRVEQGLPSTTISKVANRENFDMVVMGTSGIRGLDLYILGSVAARVLRRSNVPVLVTKLPSP